MIDSMGRDITYLRISITDKCNLRCRYCMPEEGVTKKRHEDMLTEEEMINAVRVLSDVAFVSVPFKNEINAIA